jgi:DNA-binding NarL/FixJ family response regulator
VNGSAPIRLLLVDDEPLVRTGLRIILDSEPRLSVVGEAADGDQVEGAVERLQPDVVVMDIRMPRVDGLEATRRLVARADAPAILILTTFDSDDYVYEALRAGAGGFVLKRSEPDDLVSAIEIVARRDTLLYPAAVRRLAAMREPAGGDRLERAALSAREQDVLRRIARGRSNTEIAAELFVSVETVKTHVANILAKIGVRDRTQAVVEAYESGFIEPGR